MLNNIQILRAFAAINVVLFHIIITTRDYSRETLIFQILDRWGANGVDIFFVISGFVMLYTQYKNRKSPLEFIKNRAIRIIPIYWTLTIFIIALYFLFPNIFNELKITTQRATSSLLFFSFIIFNTYPVAYVGWTLEWEMLFYTIFSIGLILKDLNKTTLFVIITLTIISISTQNWIVLEFIFGIIIAIVYKNKNFSHKTGTIIFILGIILLSLSIHPYINKFEINRVLIWGIPSFLIVIGLVYSKQIKNRFLSFLGDASYSIYLVQVLTIPAFYKASNIFLKNINNDILVILCLISSVAFGCFIYYFIEAPLTKKLKKNFLKKSH